MLEEAGLGGLWGKFGGSEAFFWYFLSFLMRNHL